MYVSDRDRNDIQKFTPNGTFIMKWGSEGDKEGQLNVPYSIEIDSLDNIYVVDRGNDRIQKFDANGTFIKQWDRAGRNNGGENEFASPEDMVIDQKSGFIYVRKDWIFTFIRVCIHQFSHQRFHWKDNSV